MVAMNRNKNDHNDARPIARLVRSGCLHIATDPGNLVLDPTCGSGTTAYVAEQWGRRWISIDTSRVALALARARIMGAKYPWYLLKDSPEGQRKEAEVTRSAPATHANYNDIRHGFVYQRVPHIKLAVPCLDLDVLPDEKRILAARDIAQIDEVMSTERHLLYVAATRARDYLWMSGGRLCRSFLAT